MIDVLSVKISIKGSCLIILHENCDYIVEYVIQNITSQPKLARVIRLG